MVGAGSVIGVLEPTVRVLGVVERRGRTFEARGVSMPGTAGYNVRKIQSFQYPFEGGLVILCSDGLSTSLTLARYPNLQAAHPTLIAAVLLPLPTQTAALTCGV